MKRSADWAHQWIFYLTAGFLFGAVLLRTLLVYRNNSELGQVLGLLAVWLALFASEAAISPRWPWYSPIYLAVQTGLVVVLLAQPDRRDYFAVLFALLGMQAMQRLNPKPAALWIGLFTPLMVLLLLRTYGAFEAIALAVIFTALNIFVASYALATRRAQAARAQNQALVLELQEANRQLQAYSKQLEQLAVTRERHRLARELHDSVTQTIFSMTLTTQSALLLLDRDPRQASDQLGGRQCHDGQLQGGTRLAPQVPEVHPGIDGCFRGGWLTFHHTPCSIAREVTPPNRSRPWPGANSWSGFRSP